MILRKFIFVFSMIILFTGCFKFFPVKSTMEKRFLKSQTILVYKVTFEEEYMLKIRILDYSRDLIFDYYLTGVDYADSGRIKIFYKDLENAPFTFMNYFDLKLKNLTGKTSLVISRKLFKKFINKKTFSIDFGDGIEDLTLLDEGKFKCVVDGKEENLDCLNAASNYWGYFTFLKNTRQPLILSMDIGYRIKLIEIINSE